MHLLCGTNNGINGTGLNTESTTDTLLLINNNYLTSWRLLLLFTIEWLWIHTEEISQGINRRHSAGGAVIDIRLTIGNRLGIGATSGVAALSTLGLGKQGIDSFDNRIVFNPKTDGCIAEQKAKY